MGVWGIEQSQRGNVGVEGLFGYDRCAVTSVFVLYLPLAYFFIDNKNKIIKLFGVISFMVCFTLVILTESRAGFLGLCTVMLNIFWYSRNRLKLIKWATLLLLLGLFILPEGYFDRFNSMQTQDVTDNEITDYSSASRLLMWKVSLKMIAENPFAGVGKLNFPKANKDYAKAFEGFVDEKLLNTTFGFDGQRSLSHTHNTFLNILVEGGIITALPFFLLFIVPVYKGIKVVRKYRDTHDSRIDMIIFLNAGVLGFLVTGFFGTLSQVDFFYWNLTILYFIVLSVEKTHLPAQNNKPGVIDVA
jgi:O-antigen ligase